MEFLSLQGPGPPPVVRPTRVEAAMASLAAHLLLLLFLVYAPEHLPVLLARLFQGRAAAAVPLSPAATSADAAAQAARSPRPPLPPPSKIPLKFAYVRVPDDVSSEKNRQARLLSDKDRRARQEMPTPPDARQFSSDPHAEGNSRDRIRTDPNRPEGPDTLAQVPPAGSRRAGGNPEDAMVKAHGPEGRASATPKTPATEAGAGPGPRAPERPGEQAGGVPDRAPGSGPGQGAGADEGEGPPGDPSRHAPPDVKGGTEYKFSFNNPGWLRGQSFGTLSFDTQGFPWGEYARQLYVIIRNNWLARIPLAAREGIAGYTCQHFVIARNGAITNLETVRTSSVPPFNKAAGDALNASSPLPPLPEEFPDPQEGVTFCFYYNMYPGEVD